MVQSVSIVPEEVLQFWFPASLRHDDEAIVHQFEWWFRGGSNRDVTHRFSGLLQQASLGKLDQWSRHPRSRLALMIILDQFSRAIYPGTRRAFRQDPKAIFLALLGLELGHYAALETPWEKTFFLLPLGHSETFKHVDLAVKLAEELVVQSSPELRWILEHSASQARGHRDVIARFGRHPHRNVLLGRQSTSAELDYLATGQLVHTRALPTPAFTSQPIFSPKTVSVPA
jgi:uncharacterized protein (DUF924 family)